MNDVFRSPRLTFNRARYHIDDFERVSKEFLSSHPWTELVHPHSKPGYETHKIVFTREPPEILPCILFDAANNLRSVLDQCGFASAKCSGATNFSGIKFPFAKNAEAFAQHVKGCGGDLPAEVKALFVSYHGHPGGNPTLWAINAIANAKKHFALIPIPIGSVYANFTADVGPDGWVGFDGAADDTGVFRGWDPLKREITLATVPVGHDPHISGNLAFQVTVEEIEAMRGRPALQCLHEMRDAVDDVLNRTEAICRRKGWI